MITTPTATDTILDLDLRRKIYSIVVKYAGSHYRQICRESGLSASTVRYHLNYLVRHNIIKEKAIGNKICYYPNSFQSVHTQLMGNLRQESVRKILLCILAEKGCNQKSIVDKVGHSVSTVSWHLKRLEESGIVMSVNVGKEKRYTLSADETELMRLLVTYKRSLLDTMVDRIVETWEE